MLFKDKIKSKIAIILILVTMLLVGVLALLTTSTMETNSAYATDEIVESVPVLTYALNEDGTSYVVTGANIESLILETNYKIVIPATYASLPVTGIGANAFSEKNSAGYKFTSLDLSGAVNLKIIGNYAFQNKTTLTGNLVIPDSVTVVNSYTFDGCSGFNGTLKLSANLKSIGISAFSYTGFSGALVIPKSVTRIDDTAFSRCRNFTSLAFEDGSALTTINAGVFSACSGFTGNLVIPDSVTEIRSSAFGSCVSFTGTLTLPKNLKTIAAYAFSNAGFSGALVIPDSVTTIGDYAFRWEVVNYETNFTSLELSPTSTLTSIGKGVFVGCKKLAGDLVLPNSVIKIGESAFRGCVGFNGSLTLPDKLETIGNYAFEEAGFTGDLVIPNSVESIGMSAFNGCKGFNGRLNLSDSSAGNSSLTKIGSSAFFGCNGFTGDLVIPGSVTTISSKAFYNCNGFNGSLKLSSKLNIIGDQTFQLCSGLTGKLTIPNTVTQIGTNAFNGCSGFTGDLVIPDNVTTIGSFMFSGCTGFNGSLKLPINLTQINYGAFQDCAGLDGSLVIPNGVTTIGNYAFQNCTGFDGSLVIPNGVTTIGQYAFQNCTGFDGSLVIPDSVTEIGGYSFNGANKLETIYLPNNSSYGQRVFVNTKASCLIIAPNKEKYDNYTANGSVLYDVRLKLTYTTTATLNKGETAETTVLEKLYNLELSYEKNAITAVWAKNDNFTLPITPKDGFTVEWIDSNKNSVTKDTKVADSAEYTLVMTLDAAELGVSENYSGIYNGETHSISVTATHLLGNVTFSYQWYRRTGGNDNMLVDQTASSLSLKDVDHSGSYYCVVTAIFDASNTSSTSELITVDISQKEAILEWEGASELVYDGQEKILTAKVNNLESGDACTVTVSLTDGKNNINAGAFTYTVTALSNNNYKLPSNVISDEYAISPKFVDVVWTFASGYVYKAENQLATISAKFAGVGQDGEITLEVTIVSGGDQFKNAGTYSFLAPNTNTNYTATNLALNNIAIAKAEVIQPNISGTQEYNGKTQVANVEENSLYQVSGGGMNVGNHESAVTLSDAINYKWQGLTGEEESAPLTLTWEIVEKAITIKIDAKSSIYGEMLVNLTADVTEGSIVDSDTNVYSLSTTATATSSVGNSYTITGACNNENYAITFEGASYTIVAKALTEEMVGIVQDVVYNGHEQKPDINIVDGELVTLTDYEIAYSKNTNAGTAIVTITGKGNYEGVIIVNFTIAKASYDTNNIAFLSKSLVEDGKTHNLAISGVLPEGVSVEYIGNDKVNPGVYTVTARFMIPDTNNYNAIDDMSATLTIRVKQVEKEEGQVVVDAGTAGMDPNTTVEVVRTDSIQVDFKNNEKPVSTYDITMKKGGVTVQPDGTLTIRLLIDEAYRNKHALKVYHVENGIATDVEAVRDGDYMVFTTDHLSTFTLTAEKDSSGLIIGLSVGGGVLLLLAIIIPILYLRKKREV